MNEITSFQGDGPVQVMPHSTEAEQQLLGAVLADNERYHMVSSIVTDEHFYDPVHGRIWKHCAGRISKDHLASAVTAKVEMEADEGLRELGGAAYLAKLVAASVSGNMAREYADIVVEAHGKRKVLERLRGATTDLEMGRPLGDVTADLELMVHETQDSNPAPRSMSLLKAHTESVREMQEAQAGRAVAIPTGLKELDEKLVLAPKRYTILGGLTSMGKTAKALYLAHYAAKSGFGVGFWSLEMPEVDLARRFAAIESQMHYKQMDRPMSEAVFNSVLSGIKDQADLPVEIFGHQVRDIPAVISECKRLQQRWKPNGHFKGLKLLVVDYLQLVRGRGESQFVRLSQVANDLKQVAKMLDVHVLALAQVDRNLGGSESHESARPKLSNLRGSGDLENAPDNVIFIHRPEYYMGRQTPPKAMEERADWEAEYSSWKGKAEIIVAKARMGDIGSCIVGCDMGTNRFFDIEDNPQEDMAF